ncbi:hypothetical protein TREPR_1908 [Treponema primitia ZAS-2]|uniref:Uncharacterized protein n=1 Tax=Treponema primitia (strain ATCC BAA-887 / DSM 12427 / ZAS-2) TaxID=545694 RepID=F5YL27_TREPZ|nr:hypothetical protein [Treponema primitia]AEF86871.1 hypothetical protein TREPR_1908 [Treponema primitia ZAS-2]
MDHNENLEDLNRSAESGSTEEASIKRAKLRRLQMEKAKKGDKPGVYGWGSVWGFQNGISWTLHL